ncbi:MAG: hypothetical protein E4H01_14250 [Lysobacterales bacterium]|nr:MAG: hypothetical protein E4H01_14250 [Xanthomonadales bacterium]
MTQEVSVHTHATGQVVAFGWQQKSPGDWARYLVRRCQECPKLLVSDLIWVNIDYDVCASCLSQELTPDPLDDALVVCRTCGMRSEAGSELPEESHLDAEDEDFSF